MLLVGSVVMGISMVIVGIIVAKFRHDWPNHVAAGWVAVGKFTTTSFPGQYLVFVLD